MGEIEDLVNQMLGVVAPLQPAPAQPLPLPPGPPPAPVQDLPPMSPEQDWAAAEVLKKDNPMSVLTGAAGTGKSMVIKHLKARGVTVCATTGKAAMNVGGCTIDRLFSMNRDGWKVRSMKRLEANMARCSNIILVDEASMAGRGMANYVATCMETYDKKVIWVGDWGQARPVMDEWPTRARAFASATFVKLMHCHRQADGPYLEALNRVRLGEYIPADAALFQSKASPQPPPRTFPGICIFATNKIVDSYNFSCFDDHCSEYNSDSAELTTDFADRRPIDIQGMYPLDAYAIDKLIDDTSFAHHERIAVGCKVVITRNVEDCGLVNGDVGIITAMPLIDHCIELAITRHGIQFPARLFEMELDQEDVDGSVMYNFKGYPLRLGYGITTHKSQGMTVDQAWVDMGSICHHPEGSRHGLGYVALSRTRTLEGLQISGWNPAALEVDAEIKPWL